MASDTLLDRILAVHRRRLWLATDPRRYADDDEAIADAVVRAGLTWPDGGWEAMDRDAAARTITWMLAFDLAYREPLMTIGIAAGFAREFLDRFGRDASFATNMEPEPWRRDGTGVAFLDDTAASPWRGGYSWSPLTEHTLDVAVVVVDPTMIGLLCVADED